MTHTKKEEPTDARGPSKVARGAPQGSIVFIQKTDLDTMQKYYVVEKLTDTIAFAIGDVLSKAEVEKLISTGIKVIVH